MRYNEMSASFLLHLTRTEIRNIHGNKKICLDNCILLYNLFSFQDYNSPSQLRGTSNHNIHLDNL